MRLFKRKNPVTEMLNISICNEKIIFPDDCGGSYNMFVVEFPVDIDQRELFKLLATIGIPFKLSAAEGVDE